MRIMSFSYLFATLVFFVSSSHAQNGAIPDSYLEEIQQEVGVWIADNSEYKGEQEPYDAYGLEWKFGINKKSIVGRLYGIIDGEEAGTFWEFRKYWDPSIGKAMLIQFGGDGSVGVGPFLVSNSKESEILQTFTSPNGSQRQIGHRSRIIDSTKHIGSSFIVNAQNEWIPDRSYTWKKQSL